MKTKAKIIIAAVLAIAISIGSIAYISILPVRKKRAYRLRRRWKMQRS